MTDDLVLGAAYTLEFTGLGLMGLPVVSLLRARHRVSRLPELHSPTLRDLLARIRAVEVEAIALPGQREAVLLAVGWALTMMSALLKVAVHTVHV